MLILIANLITTVALIFCALWFISGLLKFWRSVAMMQCQYIASQNLDVNDRSRLQYDYLSSWLPMGTNASTQIAWSIGVAGIIILLRILFGAMYAYL